MAADIPIAPSRETFYQKDAKYKRSVSEALLFKVGAAINFINNRIVDRYVLNMGGRFRATSISQYTFPSIFIKETSKITYYTMSLGNSGSAGLNRIGFKVINELGVELGSLFTTRPSISQSGLNNPMVGYDVKNATEIRKVTTVNYENGVINPAYETLPAGYELRMHIVSGGFNALNVSVNLGLEVQA